MWARRTGAVLMIVMSAGAAAARAAGSPRHHAEPRYPAASQPATDSAAAAGSGLDSVHWALPATRAPVISRRWLIGDTSDVYTPAPPDAIHFDVNGARIKLRGMGLRVKKPIGERASPGSGGCQSADSAAASSPSTAAPPATEGNPPRTGLPARAGWRRACHIARSVPARGSPRGRRARTPPRDRASRRSR